MDLLMEKGVNEDGNGSKTTVGLKKTADRVSGEDDSETCLLLPSQKGGRSKKSEKSRRKVQWNDHNGNKLAEVLEFDPSEKGELDNEDSDACICTVM